MVISSLIQCKQAFCHCHWSDGIYFERFDTREYNGRFLCKPHARISSLSVSFFLSFFLSFSLSLSLSPHCCCLQVYGSLFSTHLSASILLTLMSLFILMSWLCYAMSCHASFLSCFVFVMPCHAMLCYIILCLLSTHYLIQTFHHHPDLRHHHLPSERYCKCRFE